MKLLSEFHRILPDDPAGHQYPAMGFLRQADYEKATGHLEALVKLRALREQIGP